jgi:protein-L-isoaspartate(D-aspartate) O-methyltransferase
MIHPAITIRLPEDTLKHQGLRKKLVAEVKSKGIENQSVLDAMRKVPRHFFLDPAFLSQAYSDQAFQIGSGQTISQPFTVAYQSQLLGIQPGDRVLEIGTGSGYQTCILCEMKARVFSIERQKELYDKAVVRLKKMGYAPKLFYGDGYAGLPAYAPFDKILITCGTPSIPADLLKQLRVGGVMVAPVGPGNEQVMTRIVKSSETEAVKDELETFRFVPMLEDREWGKRK